MNMLNINDYPAFLNNIPKFQITTRNFMERENNNVFKLLCVPVKSMYDTMTIPSV